MAHQTTSGSAPEPLEAERSECHIHRDRVVCRINKIEQLTGRPLREHRTAMALHLACPADRLGGGADR